MNGVTFGGTAVEPNHDPQKSDESQ